MGLKRFVVATVYSIFGALIFIHFEGDNDRLVKIDEMRVRMNARRELLYTRSIKSNICGGITSSEMAKYILMFHRCV